MFGGATGVVVCGGLLSVLAVFSVVFVDGQCGDLKGPFGETMMLNRFNALFARSLWPCLLDLALKGYVTYNDFLTPWRV